MYRTCEAGFSLPSVLVSRPHCGLRFHRCRKALWAAASGFNRGWGGAPNPGLGPHAAKDFLGRQRPDRNRPGHDRTRYTPRRLPGALPADDLRQPRPGPVSRISHAQEHRLFRLGRGLRADFRPVGRRRLWRQVRGRRAAGADPQGLAARPDALHRAYHDERGDAGDLRRRRPLFRPPGSDRRNQHPPDRRSGRAGHRRHGAPRPPARLQQHPVDVCGALPDAARHPLAECVASMAALPPFGRPLAFRRLLQARPLELLSTKATGSSIRGPGSSFS
ncbi:hypothetical protein ABIA27_003033 [Sinorhizobium fredii]